MQRRHCNRLISLSCEKINIFEDYGEEAGEGEPVNSPKELLEKRSDLLIPLAFDATVSQLLSDLNGAPAKVFLVELPAKGSARKWKRCELTNQAYAIKSGARYKALYARVTDKTVDIAYVKEGSKCYLLKK